MGWPKRRRALQDSIAQEEYLIACLKDPTLAKDIREDVVDRNLELLMEDSDAYNHIETGTAKKLEIDMIKTNAKDMLQTLQDKTAVQRDI